MDYRINIFGWKFRQIECDNIYKEFMSQVKLRGDGNP